MVDARLFLPTDLIFTPTQKRPIIQLVLWYITQRTSSFVGRYLILGNVDGVNAVVENPRETDVTGVGVNIADDARGFIPGKTVGSRLTRSTNWSN